MFDYVAVYSHLKKVTKTCDVEKPRRTRAIRVVNPPLRTAGPVCCNIFKSFHVIILRSLLSVPVYQHHPDLKKDLKPIVATALTALSAELPEDAR